MQETSEKQIQEANKMWQKIESNKTGRALDKKECKERSDEFVTIKCDGNCYWLLGSWAHGDWLTTVTR